MADDASLPSRFPDHMNASDAVMWDIEKDPVLRSTITAVALLDAVPDWDRLVAKVDRLSRSVPRLRQRVVVPPLRIGPPRWVFDRDVDLSYHLTRVHAPGSGTLADVLEVAASLAEAPFDHARPLWEFTLVEGLEDGGAAFIQKLHHCVTDGVGGVEIALHLLDDTRDAADDTPLPPLPAPGASDPLRLLLETAVDGARSMAVAAVTAPRALLDGVAHVLRDPTGSMRAGRSMVASMAKMLAPLPEPTNDVLRGRGLGRRFHTIDIPLPDLRAAGHLADATVNAAFMAAAVEGLRRYHERHGVAIDDLRLTMPISVRHEGDDLGGNHFVPARFVVPAGAGDLVTRMRELAAIAKAWQDEPALAFSDVLATGLDRLPVAVSTGFFGAMLKHVDAVVTNVQGLPAGTYLAGAEILREYAFAPTAGAAVNISLFSVGDLACVGVVADTAAVADDDVLVACILEGFDEVLATVGHRARKTA